MTSVLLFFLLLFQFKHSLCLSQFLFTAFGFALMLVLLLLHFQSLL